jgi:hypothetical protein
MIRLQVNSVVKEFTAIHTSAKVMIVCKKKQSIFNYLTQQKIFINQEICTVEVEVKPQMS